MKLSAIKVAQFPLELRPPPKGAEWMESSGDRFAYRCLPLLIAIQSGWDLINPVTFTAVWNGDGEQGGIHIDKPNDDTGLFVESHFGEGVLTFHPGWLFRTPPGHNLWARGPANRPKHGIHPLEGVIETDWLPFTFTLNWLFTKPDCPVTFQAGESLGTIMPYPRDYLESFDPVMQEGFEDPEFEADYHTWTDRRTRHNQDLSVPGSEAQKKGWERNYTQGVSPGKRIESHQTKLDVKPFRWKVTPE